MNNIIFLFFLMVLTTQIFCQNLVRNPSFEEYENPSQDVFYAKSWFQHGIGTVDYYTEDYPQNPTFISFTHMSSSTFNKKTGFNPPVNGKAYIGMILIGWNGGMEHYTGVLKHPLVEDSLYNISFYIKYGGDVFWLYSKSIEILFTKSQPEIDYKKVLIEEWAYKANVKIDIQQANIERKWVKCSVQYKASGGEKFLTFGLFYQEKNNKLIRLFDTYNEKVQNDFQNQKSFVDKHEVDPVVPNPASKQQKKDSWDNVYAYYLIDNVKVVPVDKQGNEILLYPELLQDSIQRNNNDFNEPIEIDSLEIGEPFVLKNIYFETDKWELLPTSFPELDKLIKALQHNRQIKIEISGHTDNTGTEEYNLKLSEQRAKSVVNYLVSKGISKERLINKGYGSGKPLSDNDTEEGRAKNRRVELVVLEK